MPSIAPLNSRALIAVGGADWRGFLHNLLTNDIEGLAVGAACFTGLLTPQGRLLFDLFVTATPDGGLVDVAAARRADLMARLTMYKLRAQVTLAADDRPVLAAWEPLSSPASRGRGTWVADPRLAALGWRGYGVDTQATADEPAYHAHRLALGVPDPDADCPPDKTYPIEADFDLLHGIDFKKGCFVGQETTSRMKRRGTVKNRMLPITYDGPAPPFGAEVLAGELRAGEVLTGGDGRAIALLRLDRIEGAALTVDGRSVRADIPEWWP